MTHKNTKKTRSRFNFQSELFQTPRHQNGFRNTDKESTHPQATYQNHYYKPFEMLKNQIKKTSGQISQNMLMFSSIYAHVFIYSYRCFWNLTIQVFRYSSGSVSPFGGSVDALPSRTAI